MPLTIRSAPTSAGCSYRFGIPVSTPGSRLSGVEPEIPRRHLDHRPRQRRHDRRQHDAVDATVSRSSRAPAVRSTIRPSSSAVRSRAVASRQLRPSVGALEDAEHDVRVADVDGQQHDDVLWPDDLAGDDALDPPAAFHQQRAVRVEAGRPPASRAARRPPFDPRADGAGDMRRHRSSTPPISPRRIASRHADRRSRALASSRPRSTGRPSSASIDVARSATSGGYATGRTLMPKPRMT